MRKLETLRDKREDVWLDDLRAAFRQYRIQEVMGAVGDLLDAVKCDQRDFCLDMIRSQHGLPPIRHLTTAKKDL